MLTKDFKVENLICSLHYISDPTFIKDLKKGNSLNVLFAECKPQKSITHIQAISYNKEVVELILNELKKIERENPLFYSHFDIDYIKYHIGPTLGVDNRVTSFEVKPKIKLIEIDKIGFIDE